LKQLAQSKGVVLNEDENQENVNISSPQSDLSDESPDKNDNMHSYIQQIYECTATTGQFNYR
jgi:hypothetical protein